jgi:hypothetical protein
MWQIEDTLRAFKFDINLLEERLLVEFKQPPQIMDEIRNWYTNLILAMHEEGITKTGHLQFVQGVTDEMFELHKRLINEVKAEDYIAVYNTAKGNIEAFKVKLQKPGANEIELCFYALYGLLLLRLKKKDVSEETKKAMETFSNLLALLSDYYKKIEEGKAEF